jgi:hypothetical protein
MSNTDQRAPPRTARLPRRRLLAVGLLVWQGSRAASWRLTTNGANPGLRHPDPHQRRRTPRLFLQSAGLFSETGIKPGTPRTPPHRQAGRHRLAANLVFPQRVVTGPAPSPQMG